jgi:hypothetical protein
MKKIKDFINVFFLLIACLLFSSCSYGQKSKTITNFDVKTNNQTAPTSNISNLLKKQILLTNHAEFTNNRTLEGASGFLMKYNGANYAVTARHLLGEAGGIEPEIKINELNKNLLKWEMSARVIRKTDKKSVQLNAKNLDFSESVHDILLLNVISNRFEIETLTPNFEPPSVGETLFLIGCPYSESKCNQNSYQVKFVEFDETEFALVCETNSKVNLAGFSGAPLINGKGEILGVLVSGGEFNGKNYVLATHIKEIQKIKF